MVAKVAVSSLTTDTDAELIVDSGRVISSMTGNASYPNPNPTLAVVGTGRTNFITSVNALDGSGSATVARDQKRAVLVGLLRELALYVQQACGGDLVVLLSSGFTAQKQRQPVGQLSAPDNLRLRRTEMTGQLGARCNSDPNANTYQWRYATSLAPTAWTMPDPTTAANTILDGLTPGTVYVVQVRSIGSAGPSDWSDPAMLMAV
jgi:hypothetical protein